MQIIGNKGVIDLRCDREPFAHFREGSPWLPNSKLSSWIPISSGGIGKTEIIPISQTVKNHKSALINLIESVDKNRSPLCGLEEGISTVRFVQSIFASHVEKGRIVRFPLKFRKHSLSAL
jgi:hypothetical protein